MMPEVTDWWWVGLRSQKTHIAARILYHKRTLGLWYSDPPPPPKLRYSYTYTGLH